MRFAVGLCAGPAIALIVTSAVGQDWRSLQGNDLYEAFRAQEFSYPSGGVQRFDLDGTTEYRADPKAPDWDLSGLWWVDTNLLCFLLQPGDQQNCFRVHKSVNGAQLRLDASQGGSIKLQYRLED